MWKLSKAVASPSKRQNQEVPDHSKPLSRSLCATRVLRLEEASEKVVSQLRNNDAKIQTAFDLQRNSCSLY
eukprot:4020036-Amphidinium_carterae.1